MAAPHPVRKSTLRVDLVSRLGWIKEQQRKLRTQAKESERDYLTRECHNVWGKRFLLEVVERNTPPAVELRPQALLLSVRPKATKEFRQ